MPLPELRLQDLAHAGDLARGDLDLLKLRRRMGEPRGRAEVVLPAVRPGAVLHRRSRWSWSSRRRPARQWPSTGSLALK